MRRNVFIRHAQIAKIHAQVIPPPVNAHDGCMYGNISHLVFSRVRVARSLAYCGVFCSAVVCPY